MINPKQNRKMLLTKSHFTYFLGMSRVILCCAALILWSALAAACNIPVFRFALERWKPDSCEVVVFHNGALSTDDEKTVHDLETASLAKDGDANLHVIRCDLSHNADPELSDLWLSIKQKTGSQLPVLVARASHWSFPSSVAVEPLKSSRQRR